MAPRRYATDEVAADALKGALQGLSDEWLMCRDVRHSWSVEVDFHVTEHTGNRIQEIQRVLLCDRCGGERIETYHPTRWGLEKTRQNYRMPEGYIIKGVPRGVKPSFIVQGEQYRRVMERVKDVKINGGPVE